MSAGLPAKKIRRRIARPPATDAPPPQAHVPDELGAERPERRFRTRPGWTVIAEKELADHLHSARMVVLLLLLGVVAFVPLFFASQQITGQASGASQTPAVFLYLFTLGPEQVPFLSVATFIGLVGPLLGVAFAFDAVNGERAEGTLPRLLSQPIHRDDVINGKFAAGLGVIMLVLVAVIGLIAGVGLLRLGIVSTGEEVVRLFVWLAVTVAYVSAWLAFGLLLSVLIRRAATSALIGLGIWILLTIFGPLIVTFVNEILGVSTASDEAFLGSQRLQELVTRLVPFNLYQEASLVLLNPQVTDISTPATVGQFIQAQQRIPGTLLSFDQSLLLIWPHIVVLVAVTVVCFALAYVAFMRQEVRA
jgi:ABC-2 type transport system permease protein